MKTYHVPYVLVLKPIEISFYNKIRSKHTKETRGKENKSTKGRYYLVPGKFLQSQTRKKGIFPQKKIQKIKRR